MRKITKWPTIKRSDYLRDRLIPELEEELRSGGWQNEKEKADQEALLGAYKKQLQDIADGTEKDNIFPDTVVEIDTKTGEKSERPRNDGD